MEGLPAQKGNEGLRGQSGRQGAKPHRTGAAGTLDGALCRHFLEFALPPAKDFGFTAGLNRVFPFLFWQMAAGAAALVVLA